MQIYLPIAELPIDVLMLLALGLAAGFLAGMFGIGGGFLMTPFLIFLGVPAAVSVASSANQIIASSVSGFMAHLRRKSVDFKMGSYLLAGGLAGAIVGTRIFAYLKEIGQIELVISLSYVFFLGAIGLMMGIEAIHSILKRKAEKETKKKEAPEWFGKLPWKINFPHSEMEVSLLLPIFIGFFSGIIVSVMGIGGGFLTIPAMIYLLRMPTSLVVGTSLFQMIIITATVTFFHAYYSQTVDIVLAILLLFGSVIGAQFGTKVSYKIPAENLRGLLALIVLGVAGKMAINLFIAPEDPFSLVLIEQ